jgi:hypothetical protein
MTAEIAIQKLTEFESAQTAAAAAAATGSGQLEALDREIRAAKAALTAYEDVKNSGGTFDPHTAMRFYQAGLIAKQYA